MSGTTAHERDSSQHLVAMANDIGNYFRPQSREEAIAGIALHIQRYWTVRMRAKLNAYVAQGTQELDDLPRAALARLNEQELAKPAPAPRTG